MVLGAVLIDTVQGESAMFQFIWKGAHKSILCAKQK